MTETATIVGKNTASVTSSLPVHERMQRRLRRRHGAEKRFRVYGLLSITIALSFLLFLLGSIVAQGYSAFVQTQIRLDVHLDPTAFTSVNGTDPGNADYATLLKRALYERFPEAKTRVEKKALTSLISSGADWQMRTLVMGEPSLIGSTMTVWVTAAADVDMLLKGHTPRERSAGGRLSDIQVGWIDALKEAGALRTRFNLGFFTNDDSSEPELAGIRGAVVGSLYSMLVTLALAFPLGAATALYLEEFAARTRLTSLIEVNINNLAAVPSIVFGLLGLAVFLNVFGMPRSTPLTGGMVLALMTLPTIIIAGRASLKAVPPSVREAAVALGASKIQMVLHHVLPLAMPGMMTGTIIGMARALGETAPLLMIGMVAFIAGMPATPADSGTALPVEIYLWSRGAERAFVERTSAAILVLLTFLILMNLTAVILRRRFERRW